MMGYLVKEEKTSPLEGEVAERSEVGEGALRKVPPSVACGDSSPSRRELGAMETLIRTRALIPPGSRVLCAVSGGADSVCLLAGLYDLRDTLGFTLCAAHYDHGLRGEESRRDAEFVDTLVRERFPGVELRLGSGDVAARAAALGRGIEETARQLRYEFLRGVAAELACDRIATAHTADDNAETVLLHLARGTGLQGLCGIPAMRDDLIRPLLTTTRSEVEEYLEQRGLPHVEDSSNSDEAYARNRVRRRVVPVLEELYPGFARRVSENTARLRADEIFLQEQARRLLEEHGSSAAALAAAPDPIALRGVRLLLQQARGGEDTCAAVHLESVLALCRSGKPSGQVHLPGGLTARREYDRLVLEKTSPPAQPREGELPLPGTLRVGRFSITARSHVYGGERPGKLEFFLSEEKISRLFLRGRQTGDTLKLPDRPTKTVKKWLVDEKIPQTDRDTLPVLVWEGGVAAVAGLGMAQELLPGVGEPCWHIVVLRADSCGG